MRIERYGTMIVISGPSGAGKSTIISALRKQLPEIEFSISCTTRAPRPGEVHGKEYYFITREEFERRIADGDFIEYAAVFDNYYGTLYSEVAARVQAGNDVFLDIDVQGAMQIKRRAVADEMLRRCAEFVFIVPPGYDELERRLRGRGTEPEDVLRKRLHAAAREVSFWTEYDYIMINDDSIHSAEQLTRIISGFRHAAARITKLDFVE